MTFREEMPQGQRRIGSHGLKQRAGALNDRETERDDMLQWLRGSESAFIFWNNRQDDVWDVVPTPQP